MSPKKKLVAGIAIVFALAPENSASGATPTEVEIDHPPTTTLERAFTVAVRPTPELDLVIDLGALRDQYLLTGELRRWQTSFATFLLDLVIVQLFDLVVQSAEMLGLMPSAVTGDEPAGLGRTIRWFGDHGAASFDESSLSWKDSNFGSKINTVHGVPHFFATSWFLARGYHPLLAALAGMLNNVLFHEMIFEAWEPLSGWDLLVNSIAALTAAVPTMGNEVIWNPASGRVVNRIYSQFGDHRIFLAFDQLKDFGDLKLSERPIVPVDMICGVDFETPIGRLGVSYKMLTDLRNTSDPFTAFSPLERFEVMATFSIEESHLW